MSFQDTFSYSSKKSQQKIAPLLSNIDSKYKAVGLSYEDLSFCIDGTRMHRELIAERLRDIFGDAKIIITIRNQFDFIKSFYGELIRVGCYFSFNQCLESHYWRFYTYLFHQLYYNDIMQCYEKLFGKESVKVILFEDFKSNPQKIITELCSFLKIPPFDIKITHANRGPSMFMLRTHRVINYLFRNNFGRPHFMPLVPAAFSSSVYPNYLNYSPKDIERREWLRIFFKGKLRALDAKLNFKSAKLEFSPEWKQRIHNTYKENNRKLMEETGLNIAKYNYPL